MCRGAPCAREAVTRSDDERGRGGCRGCARRRRVSDGRLRGVHRGTDGDEGGDASADDGTARVGQGEIAVGALNAERALGRDRGTCMEVCQMRVARGELGAGERGHHRQERERAAPLGGATPEPVRARAPSGRGYAERAGAIHPGWGVGRSCVGPTGDGLARPRQHDSTLAPGPGREQAPAAMKRGVSPHRHTSASRPHAVCASVVSVASLPAISAPRRRTPRPSRPSVQTLNVQSALGPNARAVATSAALRPRATSRRGTSPARWRSRSQ